MNCGCGNEYEITEKKESERRDRLDEVFECFGCGSMAKVSTFFDSDGEIVGTETMEC